MKRAAAIAILAVAVLIHAATRRRPEPTSVTATAGVDSVPRDSLSDSLPDSVAAPRATAIPRIAPLLVLATRIELPKLDVHPLAPPRAAAVGVKVPVQLTQYCLRGLTRIGRPVAEGLVAADPRVFPLGRHVDLYVGGKPYGRFFVADIGRAVKGTVIDIWTPRCSDAIRFGRKRGHAVLVGR